LLVLFFWEFASFPCPSPRWVSAERNLESTAHLRFFSPFSQPAFFQLQLSFSLDQPDQPEQIWW
jgi:hypothetical protein